MKLKIKKLHPDAKIPHYGSEGAACFDLTCISREESKDWRQIKYGTGLAFAIPKGYVGLLYPRSSVVKAKQRLANCVGVIDSDYRGEVSVVFDVLSNTSIYTDEIYRVGDRICQMMIVKLEDIEIEEVDDLGKTDRGAGGFGSTGK